MTRKLVVRLKGGLGNQLFCYAAARRLAWANDAELVLDAVSGFQYDHRYRRSYALDVFHIPARLASRAEQMEPLGRLRRFAARKLAMRQPLAQRRYIQQVGVDFDPEILTLRLQEGTTYFDAFGQSERYFWDIRDIIVRELAMTPPRDPSSQAMAQEIARTQSVALHVRWFDAGDAAHSSNMSRAYYKQAMDRLAASVDQPHFFIFSDRPQDAAAQLASLLQGHAHTLVDTHISNGNAAADFWLMQQCKHFIIGNSTFAWWAAWLGEQSHANTQVIAPARNVDPQHSVTAWGFPYLLPKRWTTL